MANLGTLWFGADIDLTALKQKIQSGNQSILNALKMDYDPASYQQMVTKLRSQLANETFQIKITTNAASVQQSINSALHTVTNGTTAPKVDLSGLKGIPGMTRDLIDYRENIFTLTRAVATLKNQWIQTQKVYGENSRQAKAALKAYQDANGVLQTMKTFQNGLTASRARAALAQSELNKQTREAARAARQWNTDHMRLNATLAGGIHVSTQLGSALSSLFALDAARQFLGNVIEIGGQLEKQRISIGAILGDTVKANHLFEQIKGLALQSPFGVVELDQYTKQLSAYGFKYSELFDMTKRLADISAGAGTDIGRLTLALGHVRSATYLTGITLRQFSMNNIPMLKMLADYYTEVEKKAVSTAEVQKRISKRQVSYEDVIEQIRRLTDEGGMFYNMQEKISESLAAKFKNLKDAMDIMYGEMAEGTVGDMLKGLASSLLKLTRHWKEIAAVMSVAAAAFMLGKLRIGMATVAMQGNTRATIKQIMANKQLSASNLSAAGTYRTLTAQERIAIASANSLTVADIKQAMAVKQLNKSDVLRLVTLKQIKIAQAMHLVGVNGITAAEIRAAAAASKWRTALAGLGMSLKNAFMGVGFGTWATLIGMAGMELYMAYDQWSSKIDDKSNEMKDLIKSRINDLEKIQATIDKEGKPKDETALKARVDEMKQVLANSEAYTKTLDEQLDKSSGLSEKYDILADAIDNVAEKNRKMLDWQDRVAEMIKASTGDLASWNIKENLDWFFNDDITQNMSQTLESYKELRKTIDSMWEFKDAMKSAVDVLLNMNDVSEDFKNQIKAAPFEEQIRLIAESRYWKAFKDNVIGNKIEFVNFADRLWNSANAVSERWNEIATDDIPRMMKVLLKEFDNDEKRMREWAIANIDDFKLMLDGINDQLDIKEPAIRKKLNRMVFSYTMLGKVQNQIPKTYAESLGAITKEEEKADIKSDSPDSPDNTKVEKKDKKLEAAKTRLAEYKAFLTEYKKYREMYDKEKAIDILEKLFPSLKDKNGKFLGIELVDNYSEALAKLRNSLEPTSEARKKFINEINKTEADTVFDREKETLKENAEAMKEYTKKMEEQWKLYRSLLGKSGGNQSFAALAFNEGTIWDETAKKMLERFNQRGAELGVVPVGFDWKMNEKELRKSLVDAKGQVQEELVALAQEIQKVIQGNYKQFLEDSADAYSKSLTASQKLVELERQRTELVNKRNNDNDQSADKRKGWDAQISALDKQIADQKWEAFKETEEWGRIFSNLDNISTSTLESMLDKLRDIVPQLNLSAEATKAVYEAMDKIQDKLYDRNPFSAIFGSIKDANILRGYRNQANKKGDLVANAELSRILGVPLGSKVTKSQLNNGIQALESQLPKGLSSLAGSFAALQDVLAPVIDLFETLGEEGLSKFFSMGSNALGAAAQTAAGLNSLGLGNLGPYGAAAAAALSIASSIFAMHDEALQEEIEASEQRQKEMENLTKNLEKALERTLGGVYNTKAGNDVISALAKEIANPLYGNKAIEAFFGKQGMYKSYIGDDTVKAVDNAKKTKTYYDAAYASLLAQRDELQHQMESEQDKKDSDSSKISDYRQEIKEMEDEIDNFVRDMAESLYDIDIKSWAQELGDALFEAWQKGESGADAFKKKASELMADLAKNIATTKLIETALQPVLNAVVEEMERTKGMLDDQSVNRISQQMEIVGRTMPEAFTNLMDAMNEGIKKAGLSDLKELAEDTSSSTGNAIKSLTEETGNILASYVNGIRADVSVIREMELVHLPSISSSLMRASVLAETQVTLQQQIAANTLRNAEAADRIYNLLHSVAPDGTRIQVK